MIKGLFRNLITDNIVEMKSANVAIDHFFLVWKMLSILKITKQIL